MMAVLELVRGFGLSGLCLMKFLSYWVCQKANVELFPGLAPRLTFPALWVVDDVPRERLELALR